MFPRARSRAGQPAGTSRAARVPCSRSFFRPSFRPTPGPSPGAAFRAILQAIFQARTDPLSDSAFGRLPEQVLNRQGGRFRWGPDQVWTDQGPGLKAQPKSPEEAREEVREEGPEKIESPGAGPDQSPGHGTPQGQGLCSGRSGRKTGDRGRLRGRKQKQAEQPESAGRKLEA